MKKEFVSKYNLIFKDFDFNNPVSVGNGDICITVDQTGFHTFEDYYNDIPLSDFSNRVWAGKDVNEDITMEKYYKRCNDEIYYMTTKKDEEKYNSLRINHHKFSLFSIKLLNSNINNTKIINQELDLYSGKLLSTFIIDNIVYENELYALQDSDTFIYNIKGKSINLELSFNLDSTEKSGRSGKCKNIKLLEDKIIVSAESFDYELYIKSDGNISINDGAINITANDSLSLEIGLSKPVNYELLNTYWDILKDININNEELNRRAILSLYLMKINTLGIYPPAETGLTCNSWYGKFHLEMHLWHHLGLIYLGAGKYVLKSMEYYLSILDKALIRAKSQGYSGARFPKMTDMNGLDSPSNIGCLLVWQAPHIIVMLKALKDEGFDIAQYNKCIYEVAEFIASFFVLVDGKYLLDKPLIPSQECYKPSEVESPLFETEYLRYALMLAKELLNITNDKWDDIIKNAVMPKIENNYYLPDINDLGHYTEFAHDHPSVVGAYSYFKSDRIDRNIMRNTLDKVLESFDLYSMWGWDFPMLAMCAYNVGDKDKAFELLLLDTPKNKYLKNGHNRQGNRADLPLYLPGNGALLLALAIMIIK